MQAVISDLGHVKVNRWDEDTQSHYEECVDLFVCDDCGAVSTSSEFHAERCGQ